MRRVASVLWVAALSGCLGAGESIEPGPSTGRAECDVEYPNGTAFDCDASIATSQGVQSSAPALGSGWQCLTHYTDDGFPGFFDLYAHSDGRIGAYWDVQVDRKGGYLFIELAMFQDKDGQAVVAPLQPKGFAVFPRVPNEKTADFNLLIRHFLIDLQINRTWMPAPNATMTVGAMGGHAWYVWNFDGPQGNQYFDLMVHAPDEATRREYSPHRRYVETDDLNLFATVWSRGFKAPNRNVTPDPLRQFGCSNLQPL